MRLIGFLIASLLAWGAAFPSSNAATAYGGFYVGVIYISFSGTITLPEYSAGGVAITVDGNGRLTSNSELGGSVDDAGNVTFNPNSSGFTTGKIDNLGNLSATVSVTENGLTRTYRLAARNLPPGYGASGTLAGRIQQHHPTQYLSGMNHVIFTGSRFVAVGDKGAIAFSDDGLSWSRYGVPTTVELVEVAAKVAVRSTTYVAVGDSGARFYSTDGNSWTARGAGTAPFSTVAAGNNIFVSVDIFGGVSTSPDGNVWTGVTLPISGGLSGYPKVKFVNGQFVVANNTSISFSTDGANWSPAVTPGVGQASTGTRYVHVAHGNNLWVAGGYNGFATSANGTTWTKVAAPAIGVDAIAFGGGVFVAHDFNDRLWASTNGTTWQMVAATPDFGGIVYGKGRFVAVGREAWTSTNGFNWSIPYVNTMDDSPQPYVGRSTRPQDGPYGFAPVVGSANGGNIGNWWFGHNGYMYYFQSTFSNLYGVIPPLTDSTLRTFVGDPAYFGLFAGDNGTIIHIRAQGGFNPPNPILTRPATSGDLLDGIYLNNRAIFVGSQGAIVVSSDNYLTNFVSVPSGVGHTLRDIAVYSTAYSTPSPTNVVLIVGDNGTILTSPDGSSWTKRTAPTTANFVRSGFQAAFDGQPARLVAITEDGQYFATVNAATWEPFLPPPQGPSLPPDLDHFESLAHGNGRWVGLGQNFTAASLDSFTWNRQPTLGGLRTLTFGNGRFVALSGTTVSGTSTDGLWWDVRTNLPTQMSAIAFGAGKFVAVGVSGKVMVSADGVTWVEKPSGVTQALANIIYANGKFVAIGQGTSISSTDAETWERGGNVVNKSSALAGGNGLFVVGGDSGNLSYSVDGKAWTGHRTPYRGPINSYPSFQRAAYANGTLYLTADNGELFTSTNGSAWVENFTGLPFTHVDGIGVANGRILFASDEIFSLSIETAGIPSIGAHPGDATIAAGANATFSVTATGDGALSYQWFKDGVLLSDGGRISGATTATLRITGATSADEGNYYAVVANGVGSASSANAELIVQTAPQITVQPVSVTLIQTNTAALSVRATGTGPLTYQWRKNGVPLVESAGVSGVNSATLIIASVQPADDGNYDVVISNAHGSVTSATATLTVEGTPTAPILLSQPQPVTVNVGETITLTFNVRGASPLQMIWFREDNRTLGGDARITGLQTNTLTITNAKGSDSGVYYANVANNLGFIQTAKVRVTVLGDVGFRQDFSINTQGAVTDIIRISDNEFILGGSPTVRDGAFVLQYVVKIDGKGKPIQSFAGTRPNVSVSTIAQLPDGKLVVGGNFTRWGTDNTIQYLARVNADGSLDTGLTPPAPPAGSATPIVKVIALADGKLLIARSGSSSQNSIVTRLNANGAADASFTELSNFRATIAGMEIHPNGSIWVSGSFGLKRLNADGSGATTINTTAAGKIWVGPDGKIYSAVGNTLKRLNPDGTADNAFNITLSNSGRVGALAFLPDGKLLVGGDFFMVNNVRRDKIAIVATATGAVDTTFASPYPEGFVGALETFALLNDGSVLAGGSYSQYPSQQYVQRIQLTPPPTSGGGNQTLVQWGASKGLTAGVNDGPQQDPDNDGLPNIVEFALGSNPLGGSNEKPRALNVAGSTETHAALQFTRNKNAAGAVIQVTASSSLAAGAPSETVTESVEDLGNGLERVTVRSTKPLSQVSKLFFHVKVSGN